MILYILTAFKSTQNEKFLNKFKITFTLIFFLVSFACKIRQILLYLSIKKKIKDVFDGSSYGYWRLFFLRQI